MLWETSEVLTVTVDFCVSQVVIWLVMCFPDHQRGTGWVVSWSELQCQCVRARFHILYNAGIRDTFDLLQT